MNKILVRQSELDALGFRGVDFVRLDRYSRRNLAAQVCAARGDTQNAFLLEINNPLAIDAIVYVRDV